MFWSCLENCKDSYQTNIHCIHILSLQMLVVNLITFQELKQSKELSFIVQSVPQFQERVLNKNTQPLCIIFAIILLGFSPQCAMYNGNDS